MNINEILPLIKQRLYALKEEYEFIAQSGKLQRFRGDGENFWGMAIDEHHFILFNDPISFWNAPRPVAGMVGYHDNYQMDIPKTIELFEQTGAEAINYFYSQHPKTKE